MDDTNNSLNLLYFFVNAFSVDAIYELGWYAARDWMIAISGTLVAIAIAIRMAEEKVNFFATGQSNYKKLATNVLLVALAIGMYFFIARLVIDLFNAIYGVLDTGTMNYMARKMDMMMSKLDTGEVSIGFSIVYEGIYLIASMLAYAFSYCMLIFMVFAMRLAHACLVSFVIFWGAVALPMSITTGLKQLQAFRTVALLALLWPIVDAFLMYLIGGAFLNGLENSQIIVKEGDPITTSQLLFHLTVFSIINFFLIATTFAAPFVAQGLANGSGNVTGLIASFGAAGLSAGALAGSSLMKMWNWGGAKTGGGIGDMGKQGWGKDAQEGGMGLKSQLQRLALGTELAENRSGASSFESTSSTETSSTASGSAQGEGPGSNSRSSFETSTTTPSPVAPSSTPSSLTGESSSIGESGNLSESQLDKPEESPQQDNGDLAEEQRRKSGRDQARRGAIIQQQAGKK